MVKTIKKLINGKKTIHVKQWIKRQCKHHIKKMEQKQIILINKAYDSLYDLNSKYGIFGKELNNINKYMIKQGYKVKINSFDKCIFIKIKK